MSTVSTKSDASLAASASRGILHFQPKQQQSSVVAGDSSSQKRTPNATPIESQHLNQKAQKTQRQVSQQQAPQRHHRTYEQIQVAYKAGGVLPYAFDETGEMYILLGKECRGATRIESWSEFGGKISVGDRDSFDTSIREFCEETIGAFSPLASKLAQTEDNDTSNISMKEIFDSSIELLHEHVSTLLMQHTSIDVGKNEIPGFYKFSRYVESGKYHLLVLEMPKIDPSLFLRLQQRNTASPLASFIADTEKSEIRWIPVQKLFSALKSAKGEKHGTRMFYQVQLSCDNDKSEEKETLILHPFCRTILLESSDLLQSLMKNNNKV